MSWTEESLRRHLADAHDLDYRRARRRQPGFGKR
jgi:hypothetical protein